MSGADLLEWVMTTLLKVATWNVNSLRTRLGHVLDWIDTHQPDVLCIQETKVEDSLFPAEPFTSRGLHVAMHGQKSYNGVALVSRIPLEDVTCGFMAEGLPEIFGSQSRLIAATVRPQGAAATVPGVRVISAYVPNGESPTSEKFAFKEAFYGHLTSYVQTALQSHPQLVLAGDFNIAADERDIENPERSARHVLFTPQERQWLTHLRTETKLADTFRQVDQAANIYSWYDYRTYARAPGNGARIDYLFTSEALTPHVKAVVHHQDERPKPQPSDHIPVMLELAL